MFPRYSKCQALEGGVHDSVFSSCALVLKGHREARPLANGFDLFWVRGPRRFPKSVSLGILWVNFFKVRTLLVYQGWFIGVLVSFPINCLPSFSSPGLRDLGMRTIYDRYFSFQRMWLAVSVTNVTLVEDRC